VNKEKVKNSQILAVCIENTEFDSTLILGQPFQYFFLHFHYLNHRLTTEYSNTQ